MMHSKYNHTSFGEPPEGRGANSRILILRCPNVACGGEMIDFVRDEGGHFTGACPKCRRSFLASEAEGSMLLFSLPIHYPKEKHDLLPTARQIFRIADSLRQNDDVRLKKGAKNVLKIFRVTQEEIT